MKNALKPATAHESRVQHFRTVRRSDNNDTIERFDTIHTGEQLIDDPVTNITTFGSR